VSDLLQALVLDKAVGYLGVHEIPPGSNRGPEVDEFLRSVGLNPDDGKYPWCAAFVSHCIRRAASQIPQPLKFRGSARCLRLVELNQDLMLPRAEGVCVFVNLESNTTGHCGFVTGINEDGLLETLEGNTDASGSRTGGQVMRRTRTTAYPEAYIRIA
jgi:hypothetical protein